MTANSDSIPAGCRRDAPPSPLLWRGGPGGVRAAPVLASLLAVLSAIGPAGANHDWIGLDLCRTYPERMPPPLDPAVLPDPAGPGARLLGHYCNQCHQAPGPGQHNAAEWAEVLARMELLMDVTARFGDRPRPILSPDPTERTTLLAYLQGNALRPLADPTQAPPAYRDLCGDCHAAPDPAAYVGADWPALLARMDGHNVAMLRPVGDARARAEVAAYLDTPVGVPAAPPSAPGSTGPTREVAWAHPGSDPGSASGRWLALGPVFLLVLLGLGRWALHHRRRA